MEIPSQYLKNLYRVTLVFLVVLTLFFAAKLIGALSSAEMLGSREVNTMTFVGYGEVFAVPDIADIYFTIRQEAKNAKEAQAKVAAIEAPVLEFLRENGVEDKDIKTTNASFNPQYSYQYDVKTVVPCVPEYGCPPRPGRNIITGYEAYESITVKVRDTDQVGEIMQGLGSLRVSDLSGPNFTIDNEDELKSEARKKAIDDAKAKAEALADDLGVRLGRVAGFSENGVYPVFYGRTTMMEADAVTPKAFAEIPKGENVISSSVTVTYEIR